ncbi:HlyD family secretion protein [Marinoscillum sp.]|uniref:HlyD family secretion protein n=1 Tax=Marinoscillum sp. TaxID=2024838 RepID=UPI003BAACEE4
MKKIIYTTLLLSLLLGGCQNDDSPADAFGNFETTEVFLAAEVPGKILQMTKTEGQSFLQNEQLASIDTNQLHLKKQQLLATIDALKSKLQNVPVQLEVFYDQKSNLTRELNRVSQLLADSAATQKQYDDLKGQLEVTNSQIAATESQLSTANRGLLAEIKPLRWQIAQLEDQIQRSQVKAPISGIILERYKEPGELVNPGQPLYKIANMDQLVLRAYVAEDQLTSFQTGDQVTVRADKGAQLQDYKGTIQWISPKAEFTPKIIQTKEERVNLVYAVKIAVVNDGSLKLGMPGEVIFTKP